MNVTTNSYAKKKQELMSRKPRVVFNNDGCDRRQCAAAEKEAFLSVRTTPLADTCVDAISYSTGVTGVLSRRTEVGQIYSRPLAIKEDTTQDFIEQGTDTLQMQVEFCREHDKDILWSLRMNDTHDAGHEYMFKLNKMKVEHPEYLMGVKKGGDVKYGKWTLFNYAVGEVRDFIFRLFEETCQNYDIDGIELDFFRHPVFFEPTRRGIAVGDGEREMMTGLMRRIAGMVENEGKKRGKPFLIAARTPDDVDYCNTIGLEIQRWMEEGLIDIYIPSAYVRLSTWEESVRLGHKHNVKVYAGLSESRVGGGHHKDPIRSSDECYRARALNAWSAGADGIYMFNLFDPHRKIWGELGEPERLRKLDKVYFASVRGARRVPGGAYPFKHFITIPTLNPEMPIPLKSDQREMVRIRIGENPAALPKKEKQAKIKLYLKLLPDNTRTDDLTVNFNGNELEADKSGSWVEFPLTPARVREGINTVEVLYRGQDTDLQLADMMVGFNYSGELLNDDSYMERTQNAM